MDNSSVFISDIEHHEGYRDHNKGFGSMMMEKLIAFSRENGIQVIRGNLAECDLDHKDRLHHFYRKFGFSIIEYPTPQGNYYGRIELHLPDNKRTE